MAHRVLILTGDAGDEKILEEALLHSRDGPFLTECLSRLDAGLMPVCHDCKKVVSI